MLKRPLVLAIGFCLAGLSALRAEDGADQLVGVWKSKVKVNGYDHILTIAHDKGQWSLQGAFEKSGVAAGNTVGENVKVTGGELSYRSKFIKKPPGTWQEHDTTLRADGDALTMSWAPRPGAKSTRAFERMGEAKPASKTTEPPAKKGNAPKTTETAEKKDDAIKAELARLEGSYSCVSLQQGTDKGDSEIIKTLKLVVKDNQWTVYIRGKVSTLATFTIDPTKKPKTIDLTGTMGGDKGEKYLGIYELNGDELNLCIGDTKSRPSGFDVKRIRERQFEVWKRTKE